MGDCHKQEHSLPSTYQYSWELQELPAPSANTALQEDFCRIRGHNESSRAPEEVRVGYQEKCLRVFLLRWHRLCRGGVQSLSPGGVRWARGCGAEGHGQWARWGWAEQKDRWPFPVLMILRLDRKEGVRAADQKAGPFVYLSSRSAIFTHAIPRKLPAVPACRCTPQGQYGTTSTWEGGAAPSRQPHTPAGLQAENPSARRLPVSPRRSGFALAPPTPGPPPPPLPTVPAGD